MNNSKPYINLEYYIRNFSLLESTKELANSFYAINSVLPNEIRSFSYFNSPYFEFLRAKIIEDSIFKTILLETFSLSTDYSLLKELISQHGIFSFKFFSREIRNRIKEYRNKNIDGFVQFEKEYLRYYPKIETFRKSDYDSLVLDASLFCFYKVIDNNIYKSSLKWIKKNNIKRKCKCCGKKFNVLAFPDWLYYGSNGNISCCFQCPINLKPSEDDITSNLPLFVESCGFIPESNFDLINYNSTIRIKKDKWTQVYSAFLAFGGINLLKELYGSWFEALAKLEILPNNVMKTGRGVRCIAKSGNVCNSLSEEYIDNWLFERGYVFDKEPFYPKHEQLNPNGKKRADWKIGDYYIEFFGLKGDSIYDIRTLEKLKLAKEFNLKLISIYPDDLRNLEQKISI